MDSLWTKSMERTQRLFEKGAPASGPLVHYLIVAPFTTDALSQQVFDGALHLPPRLPPEESLVGQSDGLFRPVGHDGSCFRLRQAWMGYFFGDKDAFSRFLAVAPLAATLMLQLGKGDTPRLTNLLKMPSLSLNALAINGGMIFETDAQQPVRLADRWMLFVHELAWNGVTGSPLSWTRRIWAGAHTLGYSDDHELPSLLNSSFGNESRTRQLREQNSVPPSRYFSVSGQDLFAASAAAIDRLLALVQEGPEESSHHGPEATPPEPTDLITQEKAAQLLGVSDKTIRRRIVDNTIRKYSGSRVSRAEIEAKRDQVSRAPHSRRR
jgi:hypothetical protein